jgi:hypothetical protein
MTDGDAAGAHCAPSRATSDTEALTMLGWRDRTRALADDTAAGKPEQRHSAVGAKMAAMRRSSVTASAVSGEPRAPLGLAAAARPPPR